MITPSRLRVLLLSFVSRYWSNKKERSGKRFEIQTLPASAPTSRKLSPPRTTNPISQNRRTQFRVAGKTRPKECPHCKTQNQVTRSSGGSFECKACGYTWA